VSSIDTGFETGEAGRLSNRQSHSPPSPNPFRTDLMPRDFLAFLNTFAWVMRWPSPSSPAVRALASSSATPKASPASTFCRNSATTAEWTRLVMVHLAVRQHRPEGIQADADIPRLRSAPATHRWHAGLFCT